MRANSAVMQQESAKEKVNEVIKGTLELIQLKLRDEDLNQQADVLTKNMGALNAVVEMELKDVNSIVKMTDLQLNTFRELQEKTLAMLKNIPDLKKI